MHLSLLISDIRGMQGINNLPAGPVETCTVLVSSHHNYLSEVGYNNIIDLLSIKSLVGGIAGCR